jgi:hypothetical protein
MLPIRVNLRLPLATFNRRKLEDLSNLQWWVVGRVPAEICNDLCESFPESEVKLVIRDAHLRPSDDSPLEVSSESVVGV